MELRYPSFDARDLEVLRLPRSPVCVVCLVESMNLRVALGFAVLTFLGVTALVFLRPEPATGAPESSGGSAQCRACHREVYQEWEESWHARAWLDPEVRRMSNDFANQECVACHAPRPVFETGLEERVLPRTERMEEGVDCIACHALSGPDEGRVAGLNEHPDAACRPKPTAELHSTTFCASCHSQHQTITEWLVTRYAAEGTGCIECHMPFRDGDPSRGRDHRMHGGHSLELLRAAVELRAWREGGRVLVEVDNVGAGHSFPTDERSRAADVFWRPVHAEGESWRHLFRFRSPYRDETDVTETVLPAHATVRIPLEDSEAQGALEVALFYKLTPYWTDPTHPDPEREARLVERVELVLGGAPSSAADAEGR